MNRRNLYLWRMLIAAVTMLAAPMAEAAPTQLPPPTPVVYTPANAALYPQGIGFNPFVDYTLSNFSQSPNIRKFIDSLPGVGASGCVMGQPANPNSCHENNLGQYIPLAAADTLSYPNSDYYEIGLKSYQKRMHSDLPAAGTLLRGYYQKNGTDHTNNYLGPLILAKRDRPVRFKFFNELPPAGPAAQAVNSGDLPLPVDETIMGAGMGPTNGVIYTQNRSNIHLHGGLTPWISDGTPHQWVTPAGDPAVNGRPDYQKGASFMNVPDMITPSRVNGVNVPCAAKGGGPATCFTPSQGDGIGTYFYPNAQSGRLMFYHDHALGITRLNVYAGVAAGYLLTDPVEDDLINGTNLSGGNPANIQILPNLGGVYTYGIPLVIQDKSFVNDASTPPGPGFPAATSMTDTSRIAGLPPTFYAPTSKTLTSDPLWANYVGTTGGNLWMGHEYMPVENTFDPAGNTPNGRWDYAPFMIPPMVPQNLVLPSPTLIPETFVDTMIVNGTAFPHVELPPDAIRFRILNASNDRSINLQLYKADPLRINVTNGGSGYKPAVPPLVSIAGGGSVGGVPAGCTSATAIVSPGGAVTAITTSGCANFNPAAATNVTIAPPASGTTATAAAFVATEVKMVDAAPNADFPTWPRDGRDGGVPDPTTMGPDWLQIGNEAGMLAKVAVVPQQPIDYNYDRQVIPLVGVTSKSLLLMPAMRADVVVDLSGAKDGDTYIVYNDAPAAMPNYWPINDYFTDDPDNTAIGGAPTTPPGFGPNTRTIMQIRVKGTKTSAFTFSKEALQTALPKAFAVAQDPILVPQIGYNDAYPAGHPLHFNGASDNYIQSYQTTTNLSGNSTTVSQIRTVAPGNNYTTAPTVKIVGGFPANGCTPATCVNATATAGMNPAGAITLLTAGSGYTSAPTVTIGAPNVSGGVQATAAATISGGIVNIISVVEPGSGYTNALVAPTCTITGGGGTGATCSIMLPTTNQVGSITITNPGKGYISQPMVYLVPTAGGGLGASAVARLAGDVIMTGKNLTEGFDVEYGRMDIRLGSTPNPLTPTVGAGFVVGVARYIDPPTEIMRDGETILWRLSHLGVDSHAMHFHLFNVQVVNRVDWTNVIKPPYDDEIGWRETIRTNPMEDLIVAIKPVSMKLPFPIPDSNRVLDPTTPLNSTTNFYPVPPPAGIPAVPQQSNVMTNFGWEYVWHCHLLGHEENDMMRPLVLQVPTAVPAAPVLAAPTTTVNKVTITWTDATTTTNATSYYLVERSPGTNTFTTLATVSYPLVRYDDTTAVASKAYIYRVTAVNRNGSRPSNTRSITTPAWPGTPVLVGPAGTVITHLPTYSWKPAANASSYTLQVIVNGVATNINYTTAQAKCASGTCSATPAKPVVPTGVTSNWWVNATNATGTSPWSTFASFTYDTTLTPVAATLVNATGTVTTPTPTYTWNAVPNATSYSLYTNVGGTTANTPITLAQGGANCALGIGTCSVSTVAGLPTLTNGNNVMWTVTAINSGAAAAGNATNGPQSSVGSYTYTTGVAPAVPVAPTLLTPNGVVTAAGAAGGITYTWNVVAGATDYTLYTKNFTNAATSTTAYSAAAAHCGAVTCWVLQPTPVLTTGASVGWTVSAANASGFSPWSPAVYFVVQ